MSRFWEICCTGQHVSILVSSKKYFLIFKTFLAIEIHEKPSKNMCGFVSWGDNMCGFFLTCGEFLEIYDPISVQLTMCPHHCAPAALKFRRGSTTKSTSFVKTVMHSLFCALSQALDCAGAPSSGPDAGRGHYSQASPPAAP